MERKKRSKGSVWEFCYANKIFGRFGDEMKTLGQKLVKFCTHTHAAQLVVRIGLLCVLPHPKVSMFSQTHKRYEAALARIVALTRRRTTSLLQSATRRACILSTVCGRRTHSTAMYIVVDDNIATVRADLRRR